MSFKRSAALAATLCFGPVACASVPVARSSASDLEVWAHTYDKCVQSEGMKPMTEPFYVGDDGIDMDYRSTHPNHNRGMVVVLGSAVKEAPCLPITPITEVTPNVTKAFTEDAARIQKQCVDEANRVNQTARRKVRCANGWAWK